MMVVLHVSKVAWLSLGKYLQGAFGRWWGDRHCAINRVSKGCINKSQQRIVDSILALKFHLRQSPPKRDASHYCKRREGGAKIIPEAVFWPVLPVCESALSAKQVD